MFVYLKSNIWAEIPDCTEVSVVGDDFECLDAEGRVLARFAAADIQLYSRVRPGPAEDHPPDEDTSTMPRR